MNNGGKRYFNKNQSGNWFVHTGMSQTGRGQSRDQCTSTGSMLAQGVQPLTLTQERYPRIFINPEKKTMGRQYPLSAHDNRTTLQDTIDVYDQGLGRKKCLDERRQHNSHYCLCHHYDTLSPVSGAQWGNSAYRTNFLAKQETEGRKDPIRRRFPRDHSARSQMNATAQAGECFMWFGRDDSNQYTSLSVLAATNHSLTP